MFIAGTFVAASLVGMTTASARTPVQTMVGRAFNVSVETATLGKSTPIVGPFADTGTVSTTTAETVSPPCSVLSGLITAHALCNLVAATASPAGISAVSTLADLRVGVVGVPAIVLNGVTVSSTTTCAGSIGTVTIGYLSVGGHVVINTTTVVKAGTHLSVAGIKVELNVQVPAPAPNIGLRVDALRVTIGNAVSSIYVTVGHAESLIRKCAPPET